MLYQREIKQDYGTEPAFAEVPSIPRSESVLWALPSRSWSTGESKGSREQGSIFGRRTRWARKHEL